MRWRPGGGRRLLLCSFANILKHQRGRWSWAVMPAESPMSAQGCAFFSRTPESIFIPEDFDGDERLMIDTAEQFSRKEILPLVDRLDLQEEGLMPDLIRRA